MQAFQIFQAVSPELRSEILTWMQKEAREAFNTAMFEIGAKRKLRPQYFNSKSPADRLRWLAGYLTWKSYDGVAEQILQLWLLKAKTPMLTAFLDAAGIKHDGNAQVDDLPEDLDAKKVKAGVDAMLKDHPGEQVAIYLQLFQRQKEGGWPALTAEMAKRDELKLEIKE
jgi:hypothetical protein